MKNGLVYSVLLLFVVLGSGCFGDEVPDDADATGSDAGDIGDAADDADDADDANDTSDDTDTSVTTIVIDQGELSVRIHHTEQLTVTDYQGANVSESVSWSSSDDSIVSVSDTGLVEAHSVGVAAITALYQGSTATIEIAVRDACNETPGALVDDVPVDGTIDTTDCVDPTGMVVDRYTLSISEPSRVSFSMSTPGGTYAQVVVMDQLGTGVIYAGTSASGLGDGTTNLPAGEYTALVSLSAGVQGDYQITASVDPLLRVIDASIADGAVGVDTDTVITLTFNQELDADTTYIELEETQGSTGVSGDVVVSGATATFTPLHDLIEYETGYRVYVHTDTVAASGVGLGELWEASFQTIFINSDMWYAMYDNVSNSRVLSVDTSASNLLRVEEITDSVQTDQHWQFQHDDDMFVLGNKATGASSHYLEAGDVGGYSLMTPTSEEGGVFSGQVWRIEVVGDTDTSAQFGPTMRLTPFHGNGGYDLAQRSDGDGSVGLRFAGDTAHRHWRLRRLGPIGPPEGCGWLSASGFYGCGGDGVDPSGTNQWECPQNLNGGDPCSTTNLSGFGCCDMDGNNWYCTNAGTALKTTCE